LSTSYYRHAHGVILVYDITNKKSFESMGRWLDEARSNTHPDVVFYLVREAPYSYLFPNFLLPSIVVTPQGLELMP
jgi:hypothetical protein